MSCPRYNQNGRAKGKSKRRKINVGGQRLLVRHVSPYQESPLPTETNIGIVNHKNLSYNLNSSKTKQTD